MENRRAVVTWHMFVVKPADNECFLITDNCNGAYGDVNGSEPDLRDLGTFFFCNYYFVNEWQF